MGGLPANKTVNGFAVDPKNPKVMYAAMRDGIFKSSDAGESWKPVGKDLKDPAAVAVNPHRTGDLYAAGSQGAILKSEDGGLKWKRQN